MGRERGNRAITLDPPRESVALHHEVHGQLDAPGPAVLFLHGLGSCASDWAPQVSAFGERHRVLTLDLRGHGQSPAGRGRFTVGAMAEDVAMTLARLDERAAHVVGLSLGGSVGLALALRHPHRVRSLTLVNAFARLRPADLGGAWRGIERVTLLCVAPMSVVAAHVARGLFPKPGQHESYRAAVESLSRTPRWIYLRSLRALLAFDVRRQLGALRCPTLLVLGDRDRTVPRTAAELLHRSIPGAKLSIVSDSGHVTPYDQTEAFNRLVLEFIAGVD